ncbi:hypothetical protein [Tissierella sp. Yu-01]|uniref:hypothetical protein n=1 Tax=Tissierella sp. Yu-01 TaxID=3035694 RepID=UPI00240CFAB0|nr:hypothetical protein [Tissierella sp. Yu-01]WFA09061.1 hypothetical protein P3962_00395 [Tissierella sp. Yu-01]
MISFLMLGSLVLGLISWILPIVNLRSNNKNWIILSIVSISACSISLLFQIFYTHYLVKINDWSSLMDTIGAVFFAATVLFTVTIILNVITLFIYIKRRSFYV